MPVARHIHCTHCDYDLFGLEEFRCPECGSVFDPAEFDADGKPLNQRRPVRLWGVLVSPFVLVAATVVGWYFKKLYVSGNILPILGSIALFGFGFRFLRILSCREMVWGLVPIEIALLWLANGTQLCDSHESRLSIIVMGLAIGNLILVLPWLVGLVLGYGIRNELDGRSDA